IEDFEQSMDIMFWGGVYPTLNLLPRMLQRQSGHIVNITSVGGKVAVPHLSPYGAAKFAAVGFSEGLAAELWRSGVQVTTVVPGLMRTGSYLNAFFKGNHQPEFKWFALIDNLPIMSMDAEVAAHNIVSAIRRGDTELVLTLPAKILVKFHGVFPVLTTKLLGLINRVVLPEGTNTQKKRGMDIQENIQAPFFNFATTWGRSAARRLNQYEDSLTEQEQE
ncbi:MAG: SDR family NAD(P)-dependent oxidoreductase, partial [Aggregatilineales bacterium]